MPDQTIILTLIVFRFGLIIGSFLNVVIYRLNTSKNFGGRSACMSCQNQLSWYELIPVFSFLALRGRCKSCKIKISVQYPLVELATGLIFAVLFIKFQDIFFISIAEFIIVYKYYAVMFSLLLIVAVYDLKHKIIPDILSFIFGALAFIGLFFFNLSGPQIFYPHIPTLFDFLSSLFVAMPFALLWLISGGRWMGLGDAKLALGIGWFLGLSMALSALTIAFWSGAIIGLSLMFLGKSYGMKTELPFAPYMVFGTLIAFIFELHIFYF